MKVNEQESLLTVNTRRVLALGPPMGHNAFLLPTFLVLLHIESHRLHTQLPLMTFH